MKTVVTMLYLTNILEEWIFAGVSLWSKFRLTKLEMGGNKGGVLGLIWNENLITLASDIKDRERSNSDKHSLSLSLESYPSRTVAKSFFFLNYAWFDPFQPH